MIKQNLFHIRQKIDSICAKIAKEAREITLVAITKGGTIEQIREAIEAGITDIGENKVQEAALKYSSLQAIGYGLGTIKWHLVGHLQTNKAKEAIRVFDLIHSVDSLPLAFEINKQAANLGKIQDILIEVKTSPEETKFGFTADEAALVIKELFKLKNINIKGLMTIAPRVDNPENTRPYFRNLRELKNKINQLTHQRLTILSMGMSGDFEIAIEEGSNMIRLGRAIFRNS